MSFSRVIVRLKTSESDRRRKSGIVLSIDGPGTSLTPYFFHRNIYVLLISIAISQSPSPAIIWLQHPHARYKSRGYIPFFHPHHSTATKYPLPPYTTNPSYPRSLHYQTDLPVWVNVLTRARDLKRKKKKSSEFFEEEWWKKKWGKRRAKCDREDWFKENNRENVHTHTHIRRTV